MIEIIKTEVVAKQKGLLLLAPSRKREQHISVPLLSINGAVSVYTTKQSPNTFFEEGIVYAVHGIRKAWMNHHEIVIPGLKALWIDRVLYFQ